MTSLSELWRENKSKDPGVDLASILDGCRILAQSLNPKVEVTFAGVDVANTDKKNIYLSPAILGGEYPVAGNKVDCLLGLTVHEVGHTLFSEDRVPFVNKLETRAGCYKPDDHKQFGNLVNIFEDIYIDHIMTAYPGYRDYLQRERAWVLGEFNPDSVTKPLEAKCTRGDMLNAMIYLALAGGKVPKGISQENTGVLSEIATCASKMCTKKLSKGSAILRAWKALKELPTVLTNDDRGFGKPSTPKPDTDELKPAPEQVKEDAKNEREEQEKLERQEGLEEETEEGEGNGEETESEKDEEELGGEKTEEEPSEAQASLEAEEGTETSGDDEETKEVEGGIGASAESDTGEEEEDTEPEVAPDSQLDLSSKLDTMVNDNSRLPKDLAEDISEAVVEKRADLSQLLSYLAKDSDCTILAYTPGEDAMRTAEARGHTASVEEKLRRILQDYRLRRTRDYRGLMSGRISGRRLHRVAYGDQRVFQRREKPEEIDMVVCLLMDMSGSVVGYRSLIEQIICAICDAFQKEKVEFIALGYSEDGGTVNIPRLYDREVQRVNLDLKKEWNMTPSYEGLAAAIAQLLRLGGKKQKVLFHFTDGEPNTGRSAIIPELLKDARVKGITDIHIMLGGGGRGNFAQLYGNVIDIKDIGELADIVEKELRERLKV